MEIMYLQFGNRDGKTETIPVTVYGNDDDMSDMIYDAALHYWEEGSWKDKGIELPTPYELRKLILEDADKNDDDPADVLYWLNNLDVMFGDYNSMLNEKWFRVVELKEL